MNSLKAKRTVMAMAVASMVLLSACGSEGEGGGLNDTKVRPTSSVPTVTVISPEQLAQQSAANSGYTLKVMALEDPAQATASFKLDSGSRLVAVQLELSNVGSDDAMPVDMTNATVADDKAVDYSAATGAHTNELAATQLAKGQTATGWIAFQVPKDANLTSVTYRVGLISIIALTVQLPKK